MINLSYFRLHLMIQSLLKQVLSLGELNNLFLLLNNLKMRYRNETKTTMVMLEMESELK